MTIGAPDCEEALRSINAEHFDRARADLETESEPMTSKTQMSSSGRKKAQAEATARLNAIWVPVAPRIILLGFRISAERAEQLGMTASNLPTGTSANFLVSGDLHTPVIIQTGYHVFGTATQPHPEEDIKKHIANYDASKWDLETPLWEEP